MYDGVKAMIAKEKELAPKVGPQLKTADDIVSFPLFPHGTKSLLMKNLTPQIWENYKNLKDKYGFSFKQCIFSGC